MAGRSAPAAALAVQATQTAPAAEGPAVPRECPKCGGRGGAAFAEGAGKRSQWPVMGPFLMKSLSAAASHCVLFTCEVVAAPHHARPGPIEHVAGV